MFLWVQLIEFLAGFFPVNSICHQGVKMKVLGMIAASLRVKVRAVFVSALVLGSAVTGIGNAVQAQGADASFSAVFSPDTVIAGADTELTFTLSNTGVGGLSSVGFSQTLGTVVNLGAIPNLISDCPGGPSFTATPGGSSISMSGGSLPFGESCTVSVQATALTSGATATTSLNTDQGSFGSATDTLTVNAVDRSAFSAAFSPANVGLNETSTLTFTIDNSAFATKAHFLQIADVLPFGLEIANPAQLSTTCGSVAPVLSATPGTQSFSYETGSAFSLTPTIVPASGTCTVSLDITGRSSGSFTATTDVSLANYSGVQRELGNASATLTVSAIDTSVPNLTKTFDPDPVLPGTTTGLTFTLQNNSRDQAATAVAFTDDLSAMLAGSTFSLNSNSCGGSVSGAGTSSFGLSGGTVAPSSSCTIGITVLVPGGAVSGTYPNVTSVVTATVDGDNVTGSQTATDNLVVATPPTVVLSINDGVNPPTFTFDITNTSATEGVSDLAFTLPFAPPLTSGDHFTVLSDTCSASLNDISNSGDVIGLGISDIDLAPSATCQIVYDFAVPVGQSPGPYSFTTTAPTSTVGSTSLTSATSTASMTIGAGEVGLSLTKSFSTAQILPGDPLSMTLTLQNTDESNGAEQIDFSDDLTTYLGGALFTSVTSNDCTGTVSGQGTATLSFAGGTLAQGASCSIVVALDTSSVAANNYTNRITDLMAAIAPGGTQVAINSEPTASLAVVSVSPLTVAMSIQEDPVAPGDSVTLRVEYTNSSATNLTSYSFSNQMLRPLTSATFDGTPVENTCGGSLSLSSSNWFQSLGPLSAGASCVTRATINVNAGQAAGTFPLVIPAATQAFDGPIFVTGGPYSTDLVVGAAEGAAPLTVNKAFADDSVVAGQTTNLTFTLSNTTSDPLSAIAFNDDLSTFLTGTLFDSLQSNTCDVAPTGVGASSIGFSGGTLAANASCEITVALSIDAAATAGRYTNTVTNVSAVQSAVTRDGVAGSDSIDVLVVGQPTFVKSFSQSTVEANSLISLSYTITLPAGSAPLSDLSFTDPIGTDIPGVTVSQLPVGNPCGASSVVEGSNEILMRGGSLAAGSSCSFNVVLSVPTPVAQLYTSTTSDLLEGATTVANPAVDTLTVFPLPPVYTYAFSPATVTRGQISRLTHTLDASAANQTTTGVSFTDNLPAGLVLATPVNLALSAATCSGAVTAADGGSSLSFAGSINAGSVCTIAVDVVSPNAANHNNGVGVLSTDFGFSMSPAATLTVNVAPVPGYSVALAPDPILEGGVSTVTYTIDNSAAFVPASALVIDHNFPTNIFAATPVNSANTCGGTLTVNSGSVSLTGGSVAAGGTCTVSFDVTSEVAGNYTYAAGTLDSDLGRTPAAQDILVVAQAPVPPLAKSFAPATVAQGGLSTVTLSINNTLALIDTELAAVTDSLPTGMVVAPTPNASQSAACTGGTFAPTAGATSVSFNGTISPGSTCTLSFDVRALTAGSQSNTVNMTSELGTSTAASASLNVTAAPLPTFTKVFNAASIEQGDTSTLTFTIDNVSSLIEATGLSFSDTLPAAVTLASPVNVANTCGGTVTAVAGSGTVVLTGGSVAEGASCTLSVETTATSIGNHVNTSSSLTSSLGTSPQATDTLTVTAAPVLTGSKGFTNGSTIQGDTNTVTIGINNTALIGTNNILFSDLLPSGMVVAPTPATSTTCGGSVSATPGAPSVSFSGGSLGASSSCAVSFDVRVTGNSAVTNTISDLTSDLGASGSFSDTLNVTPAPAPLFSKAFNPSTMEQGEVSTLTFTFDNSASLIEATTLSMSDTFPTSMTVSGNATPQFTGSCTAASATETVGAGSVSYSALSLPAGGVCTYSVNVTALNAGGLTNTTGTLSSSLGSSGTASAVLNVVTPDAPAFSKAFASSAIVQGASTTLTFTIDNSTASIPATSLSFSDTFPAGMTVAATPNASTTCTGGTLTATANTSTLSYSGGTVPALSTCTVSVDVTAVNAGPNVNISGDLTSDIGNSGTASDTLTVNLSPAPTFNKAFSPSSIVQGDTSTLTFTIDNSVGLITVNSLDFTDVMPASMTVASPANIVAGCSGGTVTAVTGSDTISYTGGAVWAGTSCAISVDVVATDQGSLSNTSGDLTSTQGSSGTASATLTVTPAPVPSFSKTVSSGSINQGDRVAYQLIIDSSSALVPVTSLAVTDPFPTGMFLESGSLSTTCTGGTLTGTGGDTSISYSGGTVAAGATCTIDFEVRPLTASGTLVNTTGDLTSSQGNSGPASVSLNVVPPTVPVFTKAFGDASIEQGAVSTLTLTIDHSSESFIDATGLVFTDNFPSGMTVAATPNDSSTCGGTFTATAGDSSVSFSGGSVSAGATCALTVDVTAVDLGDADNVTEPLVTDLGSAPAATATLAVTAAPDLGFARSYSPSSVAQGEPASLLYDIDNAAGLIGANNMAFTDTLPSDVVVGAGSISNSCGGTVTAAAGGSSVSFSGGTIATGATCQISVPVSSTVVATHSNTSGDLTSDRGTTAGVSASLTVTAAPPPTVTQAFVPSTFAQGQIGSLVITVDNTAAFIDATSLGLTGDLGGSLQLVNSGSNVPSNSCGGTLLAPENSTRFNLSGATASAMSQCVITLPVTSDSISTPTSTLSGISSSQGSSSAPAPVGVTVTENVNGNITFVVGSSSNGTYSFTSTETLLNFTVTATGGGATQGPIELAAGTYQVDIALPSGEGLSSLSCNDGDSIADASTGRVSVVLAQRENVTCTYNTLATEQRTVDTIHDFLHRRSALILANQPDRNRRLQRMNSGGVGGQTLSFAQGDILSMLPVEFDPMSIGSGNYSLRTSMHDVRVARAMTLLAHDPNKQSMFVENTKWDLWFEGSYSEFEGAGDSRGYFGIAYVGLDYVVSNKLLVGGLLQFDQMKDSSDTNGTSISGRGWMAGPYVTARVAPNLIFDGRFAMGKSTNDISPFGTYTDTFETTRFLVDANLSGDFKVKEWTVTPNLALSFLQEKQHSYVDSLNVTIPSQTLKMGQLRFGPRLSRLFVDAKGASFEPFVTLDGIYTFANSNAALSTSATDEAEGLRARLEAGFTTTNEHGAQLSFKANYDGIGRPDFEAYGVSLKLTVPLQ